MPEEWRERWRQHINRRPPPPQNEVQRIVSLPRAGRVTPERLDELSLQNVQADAYDGLCPCVTCKSQPFRLLPDQANGLHQYLETGCGFFSIAVGGGKTGLSMLIASHYHATHPNHKILLLIPPSVYGQFTLRDLPWGRKHLAITVPWYGLGNSTRKKRSAFSKSGRPGVYILPYSCLSTSDTSDVLRDIGAKLVIADEAQYLKGDSAKTKRFWKYVSEFKPAGVAMSGTLTSRTPMEYYRLIRWTLKENCPLPLKKVEATDWSNGLRSGGEVNTQLITNVLPLIRWAGEAPNQPGFRRAYQQRLHTSPGFYTSSEKRIGTSLEICNLPPGEPSQQLKDMVRRVEAEWVHPSGDFLSYGIELHSALRELSAGFYYRRFWDESHPMVDQAKAHFEAGQEYHKELRRFFGVHREGLDTPMLVGKYHTDHGPIEGWELLYDLWKQYKELDHPELPERLSEPEWVDDWKIQGAVKWAKKHKTGILWTWHRAVQAKLMEELTKAEINPLSKGAGDRWLRGDGSETRIVVASISAHGTGKNLQEFHNQLIVQWPRSATDVEQLIGRTHRTGQTADRLTIHTNLAIDWDHEQMACTLADTAYVAETMGRKPKLLIADWDPIPRTFPPDFLRLKGWDV